MSGVEKLRLSFAAILEYEDRGVMTNRATKEPVNKIKEFYARNEK